MVRRPSGKMTTGVPVSTSLQMSFIAIGLVESTARCGTRFNNQRKYHFDFTWV